MSKYKSLKQVCRFLDSIPNINNGGCGLATWAMYLWLKKEEKLKPTTTVVYLYEYSKGKDITRNQAAMNGKEVYNASSACHVMLRHNGRYYDSEVIVKHIEDEGYETIQVAPQQYVEDFLKASVTNRNHWNYVFDYYGYKPIIEKELNIKF